MANRAMAEGKSGEGDPSILLQMTENVEPDAMLINKWEVMAGNGMPGVRGAG